MTGFIISLFAVFTGQSLFPGYQPYHIDNIVVEEKSIEQGYLYKGQASWYDYKLNGISWSKYHRTCAFHDQFKTYKMYKVCNTNNGKCIECFNNDWMRRSDRVVDLSSYAFSQIGNLKHGVLDVEVYEID